MKYVYSGLHPIEIEGVGVVKQGQQFDLDYKPNHPDINPVVEKKVEQKKEEPPKKPPKEKEETE